MADPKVNIIFTATDATKGVINGITGALGNLGTVALGVAAGGIAALGAGAVASFGAFQNWAGSLDNMGDVLGTTADESAALAVAIRGVGGNVEGITSQMTFLTRGLVDAKGEIGPTGKVLDSLGVAFRDANGEMLPTTDILTAVADQIAGMPDGLEKTALMTDLFGKSGKDLSDVMGALADGGLDEAAEKAEAYGLAVGDEAVGASIELAKQFENLKLLGQGFLVTIGNSLVPVLQTLFDTVITPAIPIVETLGAALGAAFSGDLGLAADEIREGLDGLVPEGVIDALANLFLWVRDVGLPALTQLGDWLVNVGFPALVEFATVVWSQLGPGLAQLGEWLKALYDAALPLLQAAIQFVVDHWQIFAGIAAVVGAIILALNAPIAAIIAAVVLLATAWANNWGGIQEKVGAVWAFLEPIFTTVKDWLAVNIPIAIQTLSDFWTNVLHPAIIQVWTWISTVLIPFLADVVYPWLKDRLTEAIQRLSDFWTGTLQPAITQVWSWISTVLIPFIRDVLYPWIKDTLTAAIQTLADFWTNTLQPAIEAVWAFIQDYLVPLFESLWELFNVAGNLALTALAGLWTNVLQPALNDVWEFIRDNVIPIFEDIWEFVDVNLMPILKDLSDFLKDVLVKAWGGITEAIQGVIRWIDDLIEKLKNIKLPDWLKNIKLPDWLTPGSPTPFEMGLRGIADAMGDLNRIHLPQLQANLNATGAQAAGAQAAGAQAAGAVTNYNYYLTAQYGQQSPTSLTQDVRMLQLLYGQ